MLSIYEHVLKDMSGESTTLAPYRGKVLLVVNVASRCGFTPQYEGLQALYDKYKDRGFVVLGFPCNQFRGQEPGTSEEISSFCRNNYEITFPLFSKVEVNGPQAHPLYVFLKDQKRGFMRSRAVKWNFTKFLVDRSGRVVARFGSTTQPRALEARVEALL